MNSSSCSEESSEFVRVRAVLKELGKENLFDVFKENELTDDVLDCLETQQEMRNEIKGEKISKGVAIKFSKTWFSHKKSDAVDSQTIPKPSKASTSTGSVYSEYKDEETTEVQNSSHSKSAKNDESVPLKAAIHINSNIVIPTGDSITVKSHDTSTRLSKESKEISDVCESKDHLEESSKKTALGNDDQEFGHAEAVGRKYSERRPFGQLVEQHCYRHGTAFANVENQGIEFKALTHEKPPKLPWKIMEKARVFICGVLNAGEQGIIYFGIGDSCDDKTNFVHGEIIGLEVEGLKDEISKAFQSMLDDHIKSEYGKMTRGGDMSCVKIYFVPVSMQINQNTSRYVVEIEVKREWKFCKDHVYFVEEWRKKGDDKRPVEKSGLNNLFNVKREKDEAYIRTCGVTQLVKGSDISKDIKDPLYLKYKEWSDESNKRQLQRMFSQDTFDPCQFSNDVHESLRELNSKENDYILVANKTPSEYRGTDSLAFLQAISWMTVFDLFDPKSKEDGLFYILNKTSDSPPVTKMELGDFKQIEEISTRGTTWILRNPTMHEGLWIHNSKDCLYRAMSAYHEQAPNGRIHCVFLVLSEENLREMADIIDSCVSIIGTNANKCISILSERSKWAIN